MISKRKRRGAEQQSRLVNESVGEAKPLRIAKVRELFQSSLFGIQWVVGGRIRKQALLPITVACMSSGGFRSIDLSSYNYTKCGVER